MNKCIYLMTISSDSSNEKQQMKIQRLFNVSTLGLSLIEI